MQSQSNLQRWYIVSLSREWCKCDDYSPISKHMWALKTIVNEEFSYLLNLLPSIYESNDFMHSLNVDKSCKDLNEGLNKGSNEDPNKTSNKVPNDGPNDNSHI